MRPSISSATSLPHFLVPSLSASTITRAKLPAFPKLLPARTYSVCQQRPASSTHALACAPRRAARQLTTPLSHKRCRSFTKAAIAADGMPTFAFAFDIDGVLLRSSAPLPGASEALTYLHDNRIPFILLTNGGGKHESARVLELSKKLGVPLSEENFIQSHTPFKQLVNGANGLKDKTILVTGGEGDKVRKVAEQYGFNNVVTPGDILMAQPDIWPFNQIFSDYYKSTSRPLPTSPLKIDAMFVFNDPRDWALDSQIILDLLLSKDGVLGTYSPKNGDASLPNNGWQQDGQPRLFFSNPDLFWAAAYHMPRFGQGAFQASLQGVWDATTDGAALKRTVIGKPYPETYKYAEKVLNNYRTHMLQGTGGDQKTVNKLNRVFMVGDNPESDIRGANEFQSPSGAKWSSILVKTGVFQAGTTPKYEPEVVVDDVFSAVKWALREEGWRGKL